MEAHSPLAPAIRTWSCSASVGGLGQGPVPATTPAPSGRGPALEETKALVIGTFVIKKTHTQRERDRQTDK